MAVLQDTDSYESREEELAISKEDVAEFLSFLENREEYLDTGLGAFHTDDHSNW